MFKKIKLERHSGVGGVEHGLVLLAAAVGALREFTGPHPHQPLNLSLATAGRCAVDLSESGRPGPSE